MGHGVLHFKTSIKWWSWGSAVQKAAEEVIFTRGSGLSRTIPQPGRFICVLHTSLRLPRAWSKPKQASFIALKSSTTHTRSEQKNTHRVMSWNMIGPVKNASQSMCIRNQWCTEQKWKILLGKNNNLHLMESFPAFFTQIKSKIPTVNPQTPGPKLENHRSLRNPSNTTCFPSWEPRLPEVKSLARANLIKTM